MPKTGEQPGVGLYVCSSCDQIVRLDDPEDALPPCPNCEGVEYR
jgi:DNA-directed RNA polymerase subunit RPC12/RpoP